MKITNKKKPIKLENVLTLGKHYLCSNLCSKSWALGEFQIVLTFSA